MVVRVEGGFDALQLRVEFTRRTAALFLRTPYRVRQSRPRVLFVGEGSHFITDGANLFSLRWVF